MGLQSGMQVNVGKWLNTANMCLHGIFLSEIRTRTVTLTNIDLVTRFWGMVGVPDARKTPSCCVLCIVEVILFVVLFA